MPILPASIAARMRWDGRPKPALEDDAEFDPGPVGGGDHAIRLAEGGRDRFLAEDVDAGLGRRHDDRLMGRVRRADQRGINQPALEQVDHMFRHVRNAVLGGEIGCAADLAIAAGDEISFREGVERLGVDRRDLPAPDERYANLITLHRFPAPGVTCWLGSRRVRR